MSAHVNTLIKYDLISMSKIFKDRHIAQILVIIATFLIIGLTAWGDYFFFNKFFSFLLNEYSEFGTPIIEYTLYSSFLIITVLMLGSFLVGSMIQIYQGRILPLHFSLPIKPISIYSYKLMYLAIAGAWPVLVFGVPTLFAYASAVGAGFNYFLLIVASTIPLILFTLGLGSLLAQLVVSSVGHISGKLAALLAILGLVATGYLLTRILIPNDLIRLYDAETLSQLVNDIKKLPVYNSLLPSVWIVKGLVENSILNMSILVLSGITLTTLSIALAYETYYLDWMKSQENSFIAMPKQKLDAVGFKTFPQFFKNKYGALVEKEILTLIRNPSEIAYLGFIFLLIIIYLFVLTRVPFVNHAPWQWKAWIVSFSFATSSYILSIIALRFAFTSISSEGKYSWAIFTAPISKTKILLSKLGFYTVLMVTGGALSASVLKSLLQTPEVFGTSITILSILTAFGLTGIAFGMGAAFPDFKNDSKDSITTSIPGILTTIFSIIYVFMMSYLLKEILLGNLSLNTNPEFASFITGITIIIFFFFIFLGFNRSKTYEIS